MSTEGRLNPAAFRKIESRQNARVKELRAALRKGIFAEGTRLAIEGFHLLEEAVRSGLRVEAVFVCRGSEDLLDRRLVGEAEVYLLTPEVFASASSTEHPQGIAAYVDAPRFAVRSEEGLQPADLPALGEMLAGTPLIVIAGGLQDPGNLGTLVRSAEAFGATGIILLAPTVSLWNPKALRASSGSAFRLPSSRMAPEDAFAVLRTQGIRVLAAAPRGGAQQVDLTPPIALLLGNEGAGLPESWLKQADGLITVPCSRQTESLNAAVAGSVLLYEASRQRALGRA
jgi:TrmH family RNA methyltransferase